MEAVVGLLLMMFGVSHGVESYCDGRPDGAHCYGTLGGTLDIKLMDSTSELLRFQLLKNTSLIRYWRNNSSKHNTTHERFLFYLSNGTLRIHNLSSTDSGKYTFLTFNSEGQISAERTFQIFIQGTSWFIHGLKAVVVIISLSGIWIYFTWKKKAILEGSAVPQRMESPDNSVLMTEMSPYSNT
ncbi:unnamed protein product [Oreochromis niloticus]|nr:unnamed protein product [Mustela putorius furo]